MKKIFALVIAIALTLALAVPALADGEDAAVFGTELNLVANDPTRSGRRLQRAYAFKHRIPHKR